MNDLNRRLEEVMESTKRAAALAVQIAGTETVVYAKHNAPWRDRTGNARRSIHQEQGDNGMSTLIGIGMPYGKYLELSHGGKYRIIHPAVFSYGKVQMIKNLKGIL